MSVSDKTLENKLLHVWQCGTKGKLLPAECWHPHKLYWFSSQLPHFCSNTLLMLLGRWRSVVRMLGLLNLCGRPWQSSWLLAFSKPSNFCHLRSDPANTQSFPSFSVSPSLLSILYKSVFQMNKSLKKKHWKYLNNTRDMWILCLQSRS